MRNSALLGLAAAPLAWFAMHDYQRRRVLTLFNPEQDPLGAGYHIIQSTIAVGSGGIYGKGWLNGTQSHLEFIPERATDFIFAVYCEEFGLVGVVVLLIAYALIIARGIRIAVEAQEMFGTPGRKRTHPSHFLSTSSSIWAWSPGNFLSLGYPCPLVSYGGTSLVTILIGFGILMSIQTHRIFHAQS